MESSPYDEAYQGPGHELSFGSYYHSIERASTSKYCFFVKALKQAIFQA